MTALPNPFLNSAADLPSAADEVAASLPRNAAPEAPAAMESTPMAAGLLDQTDCIHEIFYHAKRLALEDNAAHRRFVLDVPAFVEALDEPPMFLRTGT